MDTRSFHLGETSFARYCEQCDRLGVWKPTASDATDGVQVKRFFGFDDELGFDSVEEIIESFDDGVQRIVCLWYPTSMSVHDGRLFTVLDGADHVRQVLEETRYDRFVVERMKVVDAKKSARCGSCYLRDAFELKRKDDSWELMRFHIHRPNYELYDLPGAVELSKHPSISGVYFNEERKVG